jgi:hypothetical protein
MKASDKPGFFSLFFSNKPALLLFVLYLILGVYILSTLNRINPHETCGLEALNLLQDSYPCFFVISAALFFLALPGRRIMVLLVHLALMSIPFSLALHGICEHTSYAHLIILTGIQTYLGGPMLIHRISKGISVAGVCGIMLFTLLHLYLLVMLPNLLSPFLA